MIDIEEHVDVDVTMTKALPHVARRANTRQRGLTKGVVHHSVPSRTFALGSGGPNCAWKRLS